MTAGPRTRHAGYHPRTGAAYAPEFRALAHIASTGRRALLRARQPQLSAIPVFTAVAVHELQPRRARHGFAWQYPFCYPCSWICRFLDRRAGSIGSFEPPGLNTTFQSRPDQLLSAGTRDLFRSRSRPPPDRHDTLPAGLSSRSSGTRLPGPVNATTTPSRSIASWTITVDPMEQCTWSIPTLSGKELWLFNAFTRRMLKGCGAMESPCPCFPWKAWPGGSMAGRSTITVKEALLSTRLAMAR